VYRRICFLRSEGLTDEANRIEQTEFAAASAKARESAESESEADFLMKTLFAEEEARVAEAVALAEVLVPLLSRRLPLLAPPPRDPAAASVAPRGRKPANDEDRGIADFIEEMLAQERAVVR
jgi:phage terminase Nu1 subunit (DNA packaging protein)